MSGSYNINPYCLARAINGWSRMNRWQRRAVLCGLADHLRFPKEWPKRKEWQKYAKESWSALPEDLKEALMRWL